MLKFLLINFVWYGVYVRVKKSCFKNWLSVLEVWLLGWI